MNDQSKSSENRVVPNDEQCALAERLYRAREFYTEDAAQILADRDWSVYGPLLEETDNLREYLNTEIATNSELGDELMAERAAFAEFRDHAWKQQEALRAEISALKSARYKYQGDPEMVFDEDLGWVHVIVQQESKDLRAELAAQKVQNNHNWQFQEISEEALERAEAAEHDCRVLIGQLNDAETKLSELRAAVIEACQNAVIRPLVWYPEKTQAYIHPNSVLEINEFQTKACVAAVQAAFDASTKQEDSHK